MTMMAALVAAMGAPSAASGEPPATVDRLQARVEQLVASFPGTIGVFAHHEESGAEIAVNADRYFPMASTFKVPIMVQTFREVDAGRLSLDERFETRPDNRRLGSGLFTHMRSGLEPTLDDLLLLMIVVSDNQATDMILDRVPPATVTTGMRALGIDGIRVDRTVDGLLGIAKNALLFRHSETAWPRPRRCTRGTARASSTSPTLITRQGGGVIPGW
jgi:beta-lactamase class A